MTSKIKEPGSEVTIYETDASESDNDDAFEPQQTHNEDIDTGIVVHEAALEAFLEPATRINEPVQQKIARVQKEIKEIEKLGLQAESQRLYKELFEALKPHSDIQKKTISTDLHTKKESKPAIAAEAASSEEFRKLESRITSLERILGRSARSSAGKQCVFDRLNSLNQVVNLLALDPERLKSQLTVSSQLLSENKGDYKEISQVSWLYKRLKSLESALDILPTVASRLETLRSLHSNVNSFSTSMEELQKVMTSLELDNKEWREVLNRLDARVESFLSVSEANIANFEGGMYK